MNDAGGDDASSEKRREDVDNKQARAAQGDREHGQGQGQGQGQNKGAVEGAVSQAEQTPTIPPPPRKLDGKWVSYDEARKFASTLGFTRTSQWYAWCKENKQKRIGLRIPSYPQ